MLTTPENLALALARTHAEIEVPALDATTLGAGVRIARALQQHAGGSGGGDALLAALGEPPQPAILERHARGVLLEADAAAREVATATAAARDDALARAAFALKRFADWNLFAGYQQFAGTLHELVLSIWPPGHLVEERLWATYEDCRRAVFGRAGVSRAPSTAAVTAVIASFAAQLREAHRPDLLPLLRYARAAHEINCGRWTAAEGLARGLIRCGARRGHARMHSDGYDVLVVALGRQERHAEAAAASLEVLQIAGVPSVAIVRSMLNVGVALQAMRLFDAALQAFDAAERWERLVDERPLRLTRARVLRQLLELHALRGDRARFAEVHGQLELGALPVTDRVYVHRDAAAGFMRFGEVSRAMDELRKGQALSEAHGYHHDWFAFEQEIQRLQHVHSPARDVAELGRAEVELVQNARAAWETLGRGARATAGTR